MQALDEEIESIEKNDTWDLVDLSKYTNFIGAKWVYKIKLNEKGENDIFKARLIEKRFLEQLRIDFGEMFSLVSKLDIVREVLEKLAQNKWKVYHMDVKSTFLNDIIEEEIYVQQPLGYEVEWK